MTSMISNEMQRTETKLDFSYLFTRLLIENIFNDVSKKITLIHITKVAGTITSLICLYVLIKSTESFLSGAVAGSRKVWGIRLCNTTR